MYTELNFYLTELQKEFWMIGDYDNNFIKWVDNLVLFCYFEFIFTIFCPWLARADGNWNWKHLCGFRNTYPFYRYFMAQYYLAMQNMHVSYEHNEVCLSFILLQKCLRWLNIKWVRIVIIQINVTQKYICLRTSLPTNRGKFGTILTEKAFSHIS